MLGYTREELTAHDSKTFTHPDDVAAHPQFLRLAESGPQEPGASRNAISAKTVNWSGYRASVTMRREQGRPAQVIAIVEDITGANAPKNVTVFWPKAFPRWSGPPRRTECWITSTAGEPNTSEFHKRR